MKDKRPVEEASDERRLDVRVSAKVEVRFRALEDAARALRAYSLNLSAGGLCLRTRRTYGVGMALKVRIDVEGELFDLDGAVAWVRPQAIGVRFVNVRPEDRVRLTRVVQAIRP